VEDNNPETFKFLEEALRISEEMKDILGFVNANIWYGFALAWNCEFERAEYYIQRAIDINVAANSLWGIASLKSNLALICYGWSGKVRLGFHISAEAVGIAEESGDIYSKAIAYVVHGILGFEKGSLEDAEKYLLKGLEFCESINLYFWEFAARFHLGETYFETGQFLKSKEHHEKGIWVLQHCRMLPSWTNILKVGAVRSNVKNKMRDVDLESLCAHSRNNKVKATEGRLKAQENLGKAVEILKECGADGWVEKYEKELSKL
jgi:tetratricopeptide (TPR) repeat protein